MNFLLAPTDILVSTAQCFTTYLTLHALDRTRLVNFQSHEPRLGTTEMHRSRHLNLESIKTPVNNGTVDGVLFKAHSHLAQSQPLTKQFQLSISQVSGTVVLESRNRPNPIPPYCTSTSRTTDLPNSIWNKFQMIGSGECIFCGESMGQNT